MSRKRPSLVPDAFGLKRRRGPGHVEADPLRAESGSARAAVAELMQLFPRGLFEDALPPIVLRSQVYSLLPDRTVADRQLVRGVRASQQRKPVPRPVGACPPRPIPALSLSSRWTGHCGAKENANNPVRDLRLVERLSDPGGERAKSWGTPSLSGPRSWQDGCPGPQRAFALTRFFLSHLWRQKELQEQGEIRVIQLGFDLDAHGILFTEDYRTRAAGERWRPHRPRCRELVVSCARSREVH
ncbi:serine/threonine-protein kinase 19 isoform X4 [Sorex araneus]|uniref:serine/threonine-protein kinase 19 isoform X4 n=1 Tax=Sorex araneus TaxID=42254 RepID=UPI002433A32E|nr:serine/threonine-protein kinase 19 isoform X4 [Sorex araneus]